MVTSNKPHSKFSHVYALVRIDAPLSADSPENSISVVKVLRSEEAAEKEALRLRDLNKGKGCAYHVYVTRLIETHGSVIQ